MEAAGAGDRDAAERLLAPADFSPDPDRTLVERGGIDGGGNPRVAMLGLGALASTDRNLQAQVATLQNSLCSLVCGVPGPLTLAPNRPPALR